MGTEFGSLVVRALLYVSVKIGELWPSGSSGRHSIRTNQWVLWGAAPFPQVDIIGAMVIVWQVRGKIIRSVLCNIVCNNCAQCNAHIYEQT